MATLDDVLAAPTDPPLTEVTVPGLPGTVHIGPVDWADAGTLAALARGTVEHYACLIYAHVRDAAGNKLFADYAHVMTVFVQRGRLAAQLLAKIVELHP